MAETTKGHANRKANRYSERELAGFTLFTASVLLAAFSPLLATAATNTPVMHGLTHGTMFAAMAGFYFVVTRFKGRNESSPPTGQGPASWPCSCCCPASS